MGTRWRSLQESAELALDTPSVGVKLLEERTQLINPAVGRGKGFAVSLKMIRLPPALAQAYVQENINQAPSTVGEATNVFQGDIEKQAATTTSRKHEPAYRPARGRGRGKIRSSSPTRRPNGLEACCTLPAGQDSVLETNLDELQEERFWPSMTKAKEKSSFSLTASKDEFPSLMEASINRRDKQVTEKETLLNSRELISPSHNSNSGPSTPTKVVQQAPVSAPSNPQPNWPLDELTLIFENLSGEMLSEDFLELIKPFGKINNHHFCSDGTHCKAFVQLCSADCCEWVQSCLNGTATLDGSQPMLISFAKSS